jgi:hypothetical protein
MCSGKHSARNKSSKNISTIVPVKIKLPLKMAASSVLLLVCLVTAKLTVIVKMDAL